MKFRTRIFLTTFLSSAVLLGTAGVFVFALVSRADTDSVMAAERAVAALDGAVGAASLGEGDATAIRATMAPIRKDIARRTILAEDRTLNSLGITAGFLVLEAGAALLVAALLAVFLTKRWARLGTGLRAIRLGNTAWRFSTGLEDEFGALEMQLDEFLEAMAERERMKAELNSLQGWGEAAAFVAHQARTPLGSITLSARTAVELLKSVGELPLPAIREAVERTEREALRLSSMFKRMRSLSGFSEPCMAAIDPEKVFRDAAGLAAATHPGLSQKALKVDIPAGIRFPPFDEAYLREVFINLLANSAEACASLGIPFGASLEAKAEGSGCSLVYADSVFGLDESIAAKVGTSRFTTKSDGSGLGVWLVGRIAAMHGGTLRIGLSDPGGLVFTLSFPARAGAEGANQISERA